MNVHGRVAVVTGAGRSIGESYAKALAREGAEVGVEEIDREQGERVAKEINVEGGNSLFVKTMLMGMPLGRVATTDDITDACLFLLSDDARWTTAQILAVDGGFSMRA